VTGNQIRERFIEYFEANGHSRVPSSSLVPAGDPTLLFTNAGMVQFKDVFLGREARPYRRAVTAQKCVRAGGKHNDLDQVGRTARHHTFFEMLGNFSFGDYFKEDAIAFAWEFVTRQLGLDARRIWPTVFREDDEAFDLWRRIAGVPAERIVRLGEKDNFWAMGETGPCGPCSELVFDRGRETGCGRPDCGVGACDCDRWLEIWNLVFMQFERDAGGRVTPLPRPSIDTGMGLERVASVLQGVASNYQTDLFSPIIDRLAAHAGRPYDSGPGGFPFRVIADHVRACTFLIGDGVIPGNEGRGYVLRRILRRASRFARVIGAEGPSLHALVPAVVEAMGRAYPELAEREEFIRRAIEQEEERFCGTLAQGLRRAEELVKAAVRAGRSELAGDDAFILHDTFGFPLDLTRDIAEEQGMTVDETGFEAAMARQRDRARAARAGDDEATAVRLRAVLSDTPPTEFVGYATGEDRAEVLAVLTGAGPTDEADAGTRVEVVLDRTPFYAEAGGQVGDRGRLLRDGLEVAITTVRRHADGRVLHGGQVLHGRLRPGIEVRAVIEPIYRKDVARNHTATHLLHAALRVVLGGQVAQAGSLVAADHLRFDFTHLQPVTVEELARIEALVNEWIFDDLPVEWHRTGYRQAVGEGAVALFGEKYGETVRVVKVGEVGAELCGGTHVRRTGEVGLFKILAETGIGSGLRRIEAITGRAILERLARIETRLADAAARLSAPPEDLLVRLDDLLERLRARERQLAESQGRLVVHEADRLLEHAVWIGDSRLVTGLATLEGAEALRAIGDVLRERVGSGVALLAARNEERVQVMAAVTPDLVRRGVNASRLVACLAEEIGGGGGGRPDLAQAGGSRPDGAERALAIGTAEARRMLEAAGESPASR